MKMPQSKDSDVVIYEGNDQWSALYVDGRLEYVGDHYNVNEKIHAMFDITVIQSDDFMLGGNYRSEVARSISEITEYAEEIERKYVARAQELRNQAYALLDEARQIDGLTEG